MQFAKPNRQRKVGFFESCEFRDKRSRQRIKRLFHSDKTSHKRDTEKRSRDTKRSL
ncbi:unnamed protein product [marine sediment metagenome]|uniref:Uncharacterized protein n=1 Tax=marine sediment metagenome TaxID=412755 RepID=X1U5R3_9ZZZZ